MLNGAIVRRALCSSSSMILALMYAAAAEAQPAPASSIPSEEPATQTSSTPQAAADETSTGEEAEVVVTGIRGSLTKAINVKRQATAIVDAISAEDVGKFPDANIAESVQRISGVQINRLRGEGQSVNIRGLPSVFTLVTLNGRVTPNALTDGTTKTRSFDFSILPSEFIRTLEVYKSPTADLTEGGLSGVVNIRTPRAFDTNGLKLAASAQANYESNSGKKTPRAAIFASNTFAGDTIGLSLGLSYDRRKQETHQLLSQYTSGTEASGIPAGSGPDDLNGNGVIEPTLRVRFPQMVHFYTNIEDQKRFSGIGSIQYRNNHGLELLLEGLYSRLDVANQRVESSHDFFQSRTVVPSGIVTENLLGLPTVTRFEVSDLDLRGGTRIDDRLAKLYSLTGAVKYEFGSWKAEGEATYSSARQTFSYLNLANNTFVPAAYDATAADDVGSIIYRNGYDQIRLNPQIYRLLSLNGQIDQIGKDDVFDAKLSLGRTFDSSWLKSVAVGGEYQDRKQYQNAQQLTVTDRAVSNLVGGLPPGPVPNSFSAAPFMHLVRAGSGVFLGSYHGNNVFPREFLVADTEAFLKRFTHAQLIAAGTLAPNSPQIVDVREKVLAGYARANIAIGRLSGNLGLRYVQTRQTSVGFAPDLTRIEFYPESGGTTIVPAAQAVVVNRKYSEWLPSINLKLDVSDNLVLRFSASRTIARPNLVNLSPSTTVNGSVGSITQQNPFLEPFRANNFDATAEWYFSSNGLVGASLFYKDLKSLIRAVTVVNSVPIIEVRGNGDRRTINRDFTVSTLANGQGVKVKGFEAYFQQPFTWLPAPFDGLGVLMNYTYIDNSDPKQLTAASKHNFNVIGYYEKGPIGLRASYSWRDGFLTTPGDTLGFIMGRRAQPFGTLDANLTVNVTKNFQLVVEASNILDADEKERYVADLPYLYTDPGRRFLVGARVKL